MNLSFLPDKYLGIIKNIDYDLLYEIRLRTGYPTKINYNNKIVYLSYQGLTTDKDKAIICTNIDITEIINNLTERSLYAFNDRIKEGYLSTTSGVRIGLAGECVFCDNKIQTIKNFSSLNIRVPHQIKNCSNKFIKDIISKGIINNTLLISPPFLGKTTLLKDIAIQLNSRQNNSILIIDERGEFAEIDGENIDKITFSNKTFAFNNALRSLSPSIVITDELSSKEDWEYAKNAINSGVKIIASCHSDSLDSLIRKDSFIENLFERYIVLSKNKSFGQVDKIFNKELRKI